MDIDSEEVSEDIVESAVCEHFKKAENHIQTRITQIQEYALSIASGKHNCPECSGNIEITQLWVCSECNSVRCGRYVKQHALQHSKEKEHWICINLKNQNIWCYACNRDILYMLPAEDEELEEKDDDPTARRHSRAISYENESFVHNLLQDDSVFEFSDNERGGLCGLVNLGNTCYLNSGLQALVHCPALIRLFCQDTMLDDDKAHRVDLVRHFADLMRRIWSGRYNRVSPREIVSDIWAINSSFRGYGQQDSQEFLRNLIDKLHEYLKYRVKQNPSEDDESSSGSESDDGDIEITDTTNQLDQREPEPTDEQKEMECEQPNGELDNSTPKSSSRENESSSDTQESETEASQSSKPRKRHKYGSVIADIFRGVEHSEVTCVRCGNITINESPFYDLSLEIPGKTQIKRTSNERNLPQQPKPGWISSVTNFIGITSRPIQIETCLHSFCTTENLQKDDQYYCEKCKEKVNASKRLFIAKLPEVLCLHIKRFSHNSFWGSKLNNHIEFPLDHLDMGAYLDPNRDPKHPYHVFNTDTDYSCFAVIRHSGGVSGGHYVCYARHPLSKRWYEFNDDYVTEISPESVKNQQAYILFYSRRNNRCGDGLLRRAFHLNGGPKVFLSKQWLHKVDTFSFPGRVDNNDLCCVHGAAKNKDDPTLVKRSVQISAEGWMLLAQKYNGGPVIDGEPQICSECQLFRLRLRREKERKVITRLDSESRNNTTWFLICEEWLHRWRQFIKGKVDILPGEITNHVLLNEDGTPQPNLKPQDDYRGINPDVWQEFLRRYGGGPAIQRGDVDIYGD